MDDQGTTERLGRRVLALKCGLLLLWAAASFGVTFFARDLQFSLGRWPFSYWFAAQGALLAFIAIVVFYAWAMQKLAPDDSAGDGGG